IATPAGWTRQEDPMSHVVTIIPANAAVASSVALIVSPIMNSGATSAEFHTDMLAKAVDGRKLLAPTQQGTRNGMLASSARVQTPGGQQVWLLVYTAHWADKGQALVFASDREDLFKAYLPAVHAVVSSATIPADASAPATSSVSQPPHA